MNGVRLLLVLAAVALPASAALAGSEADISGSLARAAMVWNIQPQVPDAEPVTVKVGQAYAWTRILPPALYLLDAPATLTDGTPLLEPGTELAALTGVARTGCTMRIPPVAATMKPASALWSKKNRYLCLHDADGDGRFDKYVWLYSATMAMLVGRWQFVPLEGRIAPVAYRQTEPATSKLAPWLALVLINDAKWVSKLRFGGVLASGVTADGRVPYTSFVAEPERDVSIKTLPARFQAFGGTFEVVGRANGGLTIRTITPIPSAPFSAGW